MPENEVNTLSSKLSKFSSLGSKHRYRLVTWVVFIQTLRLNDNSEREREGLLHM